MGEGGERGEEGAGEKGVGEKGVGEEVGERLLLTPNIATLQEGGGHYF